MQINREQFGHFTRTGYLKLGSVMEESLREKLLDFVTEERAKDIEKIRRGMAKVSTKVYGLYERNPALMDELLLSPGIIEPVQGLLGPNIVYLLNRHNQGSVNTPEDTSREARLHRDILQPARGVLTVAAYLEDSNIENGCTYIVPGSHRLPYVGVPQPNGGGTWMDEHGEYDGVMEQAVPVPMAPGHALAFDGTLFHGVSQNTTDRTRTSIILGFRPIDELEFARDKTRTVVVAGNDIYRGNDI